MNRFPRYPSVENSTPHTAAAWAKQFGAPAAQVTAWVDWERIAASSTARVHEYHLTRREDIGQLQTLWYHDADWQYVPWCDRGNERARVREVVQRPNFPTREHVAENMMFANLAHDMHRGDVLTIPAWQTSDGELVILDGTHRTCGMYCANSGAEIRVLAIEGLDDPLMIPDIAHETHAAVDDAAWHAMYLAVHQNFSG